jgi:glycosyltransferase involved in cell wall biosynthesis
VKLQNKTRCLFVSHVPLGSIFEAGAGNSLRTFLEHQNFLEADLILPLFIGHLTSWSKIIRQAFHLKLPNVKKIYFMPLPYQHCHEGAPTSFKAKSAYFINNIFAMLLSPLTNKIIYRDDYKFVHLNSVVLHKLITEKTFFILHVREVLDRDFSGIRRVIQNLEKSSGLIFIDKTTYRVCNNLFRNNSFPCHHIINNPFEMHDVLQLKKKSLEIQQKYGLKNFSGKIFTYLGMLHPIKGIELIINAFLMAKLDEAILLMVGPGNTSHMSYYKILAESGGNKIIFLGRLDYAEVKEIYAISDFVVRGDPDFRIGRTTFEALFSGCHVIIPGRDEDVMQERNLQPFKSRIFLYTPSDNSSLAQIFQKAYQSDTSVAVDKDFPDNNIQYHCEEFKNFLRLCNVL